MQKQFILLVTVLGVFTMLLGCNESQRESKRHRLNTTPFVEKTKEFLQQHPGRYNDEVFFVADLEQPKQSARFSVISLKTGDILAASHVLNGRQDEQGRVIYSNVPESYTSSRGFAKVSERYMGQFGKAFKLDGLEATNSNMRRRAIVLHAYPGVGASASFNSQGCPTVSPSFLEELDEYYIKPSRKPILLLTP
jgi:hypothetical protein